VYRRTVAAFLTRSLGGPLAPDEAAARAEAVDARRLPDTVRPPTQIEQEPGGFRSLVRLATPPGRADRNGRPEVGPPADEPVSTDALGAELAG
jgi:hypothetical protein